MSTRFRSRMRERQAPDVVVFIAPIQCAVSDILRISHAPRVLIKVIVIVVVAEHDRDILGGWSHTVVVADIGCDADAVSDLIPLKTR